ncbi:MAG: hypothetical protein KY443_02460 [Actinobacteria bacterium]|nr:hypothetical protein [Actinomycetota bacterium]
MRIARYARPSEQAAIRGLGIGVVFLLVAGVLTLQARSGADDAVGVTQPELSGEVSTTTSAPPVTAPTVSPPAGTPTTQTPARSSKATTTTVPVATTIPTTAPRPNWDYRVDLSSACVSPGDPLTVTFHLGSMGVGALAVVYHDSSTRESTNKTGTSGEDGMLAITVTIPLDAPLGDAAANTVANAGQEKAGHKIVPFKIVAKGQAC